MSKLKHFIKTDGHSQPINHLEVKVSEKTSKIYCNFNTLFQLYEIIGNLGRSCNAFYSEISFKQYFKETSSSTLLL